MKTLKRILAGTLALMSIFPVVKASEKSDSERISKTAIQKKYESEDSLIKRIAYTSIAGGMVVGAALDWAVRELWIKNDETRKYNEKILNASKYVSYYYSIDEIRCIIKNHYPQTRIGEDFKYLFKVLENVDTKDDPHSQEPINVILERVYDFIAGKSFLVSERDLYRIVRNIEGGHVTQSNLFGFSEKDLILDMAKLKFAPQNMGLDKLKIHIDCLYDIPRTLKNFKNIKYSNSEYRLKAIILNNSEDSSKSDFYVQENGKWYERSIYNRSLTREVPDEVIDGVCSGISKDIYLVYETK